jgi:ribosomal protein L7/L12
LLKDFDNRCFWNSIQNSQLDVDLLQIRRKALGAGFLRVLSNRHRNDGRDQRGFETQTLGAELLSHFSESDRYPAVPGRHNVGRGQEADKQKKSDHTVSRIADTFGRKIEFIHEPKSNTGLCLFKAKTPYLVGTIPNVLLRAPAIKKR